jgi:uncharacterized protein YbgA (DUF1722 family)
MRLVRLADGIRLLTVKTGVDRTDQLLRYADERVAELATQDLCGFVLKKDSPSCGVERVKIYAGRGTVPTKSGRGLFAATLADRCPDLPIEEEGRMCDPQLRDNFVERVFAYGRLRALFGARWNRGALVRFHAAHKLTLMAHSPAAYQELGRLVAQGASLGKHDLKRQYSHLFMVALSIVATRRRHANALQHMLGYFSERLDRESRAELLGAIDDYVRELVPLVVPITLIRHHVRVHNVAYLAGQVYLDPHPKELMLRNHV